MGLGRGREVVARSFHPAKAGVLTRPSMFSGSTSGTTGDLPLRPITSATAVDPLSVTDLSDWFDPFLKHFMRETLRSGGEVVIAEDGPRVRGVFLHDPVENVASIFTRSPALANAFYRLREKAAVYSEIPLGTARENIDIFAIDLADGDAPYRFSHAVRAVREEDRGRILALMTSIYGQFNAGWLGPVSQPTEKGYVAEADGRPVGAAWVSAVEGHGRLHSLSVLPSYPTARHRLGPVARARAVGPAERSAEGLLGDPREQRCLPGGRGASRDAPDRARVPVHPALTGSLRPWWNA